MLGRAVQEHHPGFPASKGNTVFQHYKTNPNPNALTPASATALNASARPNPQSTIPLKRTASQAKMSQDGDRVAKLHNFVDFNENDFEDDADLDFSESFALLGDSSQKQSFTAQDATGNLAVPKLSSSPATPLPWSSSPPMPQSVKAPRQTPPVANMTKRRTLPWMNEVDNDSNDKEDDRRKKVIPGVVQETIKKAKEHRDARAGSNKYTPLPKDKANSKFPWNTTASAVKEQQKQHRQGQRKPTKDHEGDQAAKSNSRRKRETVAKVFLSDEQKSVLDLVSEKNKSVFFTGSAGTGKSVLLREIIKVFRQKHKREPDRVAVTASTGLAACNVGGVTLHSFAGIGLGKEAVPELVKKIKRNQKAKTRWMRTKVLIIDEISMVDGDLFDKLESIARAIRNNGRPFGGIQLVITGDFFQLPPVPDYGKVSKFCFDAATWNTSVEHTIGLTQVFRQKDPAFANMLNEMRLGKLTQKSIDAFRALNRPLSFGDDFEATELFPTRNEVDNANSARMRNLVGKEWEYRAEDGGSITDPGQRSKLLTNCMAPPSISLKKGAQVMLIKNIDDTLVNGSVGKVVAFMDEKTFDIYHEDEDEFQAVETMELDDGNITESRKKLKALINKDLAGETSQKWPLVRFSIADGSSRDLLCQREAWKIELPNGEVQASRSQVPLILAWALSIHKAQGQTLERVKVDLGKIFEKGQAYVALSRATCQEGLQISRFDPKKVMAHPRVGSFYASLYSVNATSNSKVDDDDLKKGTVGKGHGNDFADFTFDGEEDEEAMLAMYGQ